MVFDGSSALGAKPSTVDRMRSLKRKPGGSPNHHVPERSTCIAERVALVVAAGRR